MALWRWSKWLPQVSPEARLDLGTGETPLVRSCRLGPAAGMDNLYFKLETTNPTGSYKDRFGALAISDMVANSKTRCVATSSGNSGAALAAHCAVAGIRCQIAVHSTVPDAKLGQMRSYGADLYKVKGFLFDVDVTHRTFEYLCELGEQPDAGMQISAFHYSPIGMGGVKTISYELAEQSDEPIDHVFIPVGGGGLALAVAQGFDDLAADGVLQKQPQIHCVQPEGNNTVAGALRAGAENATPVPQCTSQISGLMVPTVIDGNELIRAARQSGGTGFIVSDERIWQLQQRLAGEEGIYSEPAGAVALAGALSAKQEGRINGRETVMCLVTGAGFKDPASIDRMLEGRTVPTVELNELKEQMETPDSLPGRGLGKTRV